MNFPYAAILRNAYELTRNHFQLWVFGIFISAATWLNFLLLNIAFDRRELVDFDSSEFVSKLQSIADSPLAIANLFVVVIILFFSALSKATVVWSAQKLAGRQQWASDQKKEFSVKTALKEGGKYAGTIFWLQLLVLFLLLLLVISIAAPVVYLAVIGQIGRAVALTFLGMAILVPVSILLGYMFIYSPIFAVLYRVKARAALGLAFGLAQNKLKESLILGAFLVGISLLFMTGLAFGIIVVSVPVAFLSLVFAQIGLTWAVYMLVFVTAFLGLCAVVILLAGLTVFNNCVWVLAVMEMVKTEKADEDTKVFTAEVEPAS